MEKEEIYYFTLVREVKRDVEIHLYLKLSDYSSFSNLFTIEYDLMTIIFIIMIMTLRIIYIQKYKRLIQMII